MTEKRAKKDAQKQKDMQDEIREEQRIRDYFKQVRQEKSAQPVKEFDRRNKSPVIINTREDPMPAYDKINRSLI